MPNIPADSGNIQYARIPVAQAPARRLGPLQPLKVKPAAKAGQGIVALRTLPEGPIDKIIRPAISFHSGCDASAGTSTSTNGGLTIRNVSLELLFWGSYWNGSPSPTVGQVLTAIGSVLQGPYMSSLIQYGVGPGSLTGAGIVTGVEPSNGFSNSQIENVLSALFNQGSLSQAGLDNLYILVLPPNIGSNNSGISGDHTYYINFLPTFVVWYGWAQQSGNTAQARLDFITSVFSHELAEAVSDPGGDGIQVNPRNSSNWNEIGDACCSTYRLNGVLVQSYWSDRDQACIVPTKTELAAGGNLACFGVDGAFSRVYSLDTNKGVIELAWDQGWGFADPLTGSAGAAANAPSAAPGSALTCFGVNGSASRVYYLRPTIGENLNTFDVSELYWDNGWGYNALTGPGGRASGAPSAAPGSALVCFGVNGSASRVYYLVNNLSFVENRTDVYELYWDNGWGYNQLTGTGGKAGNAPSAAAGSGLASFGVNGSASRVYYLGPNNDVYELYWDNGWHYNQLTGTGGKAANAPSAAPGSALTCFGVNGSASRVYYLRPTIGENLNTFDVSELYWDNGWGYNALTGPGGRASGAPSAAPGSALACFGVNGSASRVYYLVNNLSFVENRTDVYELYWDNGWGYNQLTGTGGKAANAPSAAASSGLACFGVNGSASRVYYFDLGNDINELYWDNGWSYDRVL